MQHQVGVLALGTPGCHDGGRLGWEGGDQPLSHPIEQPYTIAPIAQKVKSYNFYTLNNFGRFSREISALYRWRFILPPGNR